MTTQTSSTGAASSPVSSHRADHFKHGFDPPGRSLGLEVKNLKPETMRTLIKMARDIYPHDRLADRFYAVAMKGYDEKAGSDAATRPMLETGVSTLDELARKSTALPTPTSTGRPSA